ncbi:DNA recombination protein RmuC [Longimicrobium sp.]|jgi:DNA recombination protein RmuC|uniref:DNA recombination protein RmuC n=1 Tax=Longimicrobium sp. TaxID=2029185 RepID=UPI002ED81A5C
MDPLLALVLVLQAVCIGLLVVVLRRPGGEGAALLATRLDGVDKSQERTERVLRDELARAREEAGGEAGRLRGEVAASIKTMGDTVFQHLGTLSADQQKQLGNVLAALGQMTEAQQGGAGQLREEVGTTLKGFNDSVVRTLGEISTAQKLQMDGIGTQIGHLTASTGEQMEKLRLSVEGRLEQIRADNTAKLEQVRQTVDEKLQGVLEQRLGESFRLVSDRLEQVHKGLGEMQTLASGVGDLKKVLSNVKVRGNWGEVQLASLLEQVLTPDQYVANVATNEFSGQRVEFAIRLPGHDQGDVLLPIDAKFPQEDYLRMVEAQEAADAAGMEAAARAMEERIRGCARDICTRYLNPPRTTDFAIMFLPTEGLYAEVVRRPGLTDALQRDWRVVVAGPTTLWAVLNSLQMGFRTLAIQKRSSEVWTVLGAVKTEFGKFGGVLQKVQKKLEEASKQMDQAGVRTRAIERKLRDVQQLPAAEAHTLLLGEGIVIADLAEAASD